MISPEYFLAADNRDLAKSLFRAAVRIFTMEISSKCNRRCSYCPNSLTDRISDNRLLPWDDIERITEDLAEIDYDGVVSLHNYNEPTLDERLPDIIGLVRRKVPRATIGTTTNGDFLTKDFLQLLASKGLSYLRISPHLAPGQEYSMTNVLRRIGDITDRIGLQVSLVANPEGVGALQAKWDGLPVRLYTDHANYGRYGHDRGGSLNLGERPHRTAPCDQPFKFLYILYNGDVTPCCHINPDAAGMEKYVVCNYHDFSSIFEVYAGAGMAEWRRSLFGNNPKSAPCATCVEGPTIVTSA